MSRSVWLAVGTCLLGICSATELAAQKNPAEEKREMERIREAEQALNKAKQELQAAEKKFQEAARKVNAADRAEDQAKAAIDKAREAAENKLEDSTGLPELLRKVENAKRDFEALAAPLRQAAMQSAEYQSAATAAAEAEARKTALRENPSLDDAQLAAALTEINKVMRKPDEILQAAVLRNKNAAKGWDKFQEFQQAAAAAREKVRDRIDQEPGLRRAVEAYQQARTEHQQAIQHAAQVRAAWQREQQAASAAAQRVASAKAADRRDDQNDRNNGKNKGKGKK